MTVSSNTNVEIYLGSGSAGPFTFPFNFFANSDISLVLTDALGIDQLLIDGADYALTGAGGETGGSVTLTSPLLTGETLEITRTLDIVQEISFKNQGAFYPSLHEGAFDRAIMIIQQINNRLSRLSSSAINLPSSYSGSNQLPDLPLANMGVGFDALGGLSLVPMSIGSGNGSGVANLPWVDIRDFGGDPDAPDNTAALNLATAECMTVGKPLWIPAGVWSVSGQWKFPNDGAVTFKRQKPLIIMGAGSDRCATPKATPSGGTILDLKYAGGSKILSEAFGTLEITGVTLWNSGTDTQPLFTTEFTTVHIHDCAIWGNSTNKNNGIVLGGIGALNGFQGYGSTVNDNSFQHCDECITLRKWANAVNIHNNFITGSCGGDSAIVIDPTPAGGGEVIVNVNAYANNIEMNDYTNGFYIKNTSFSNFHCNGFHDGDASVKYGYYFDSIGVSYNTFTEGMTQGIGTVFCGGNATALNLNKINRVKQATVNQEPLGVDYPSIPNIRTSIQSPTIFNGVPSAGDNYSTNERFSVISYVSHLVRHFIYSDQVTEMLAYQFTVYPPGAGVENWSAAIVEWDTYNAIAQIRSAGAIKFRGAAQHFGLANGTLDSIHQDGVLRINKKVNHQSMPDLAVNSTSPDISASAVFVERNTNPTSITTFTGAVARGEIIHIECTSSNTTFVHNTGGVGGLWLKSGANVVSAAHKTLSFMRDYVGNYWLEI